MNRQKKRLAPLAFLAAVLMAVSCASGKTDDVLTGSNETESETQPATEAPHTHTWQSEFVEPTLTEQGYTKETCTCGESRILGYTGLSGEKEAANSVLFIGNSYTYYNDSPTIFEMIANGQGYSPYVMSVTASGYYLRQYNDPNDANGKKVQAQLTGSIAYDVVFLQEQTTLPALNAAEFYTNVRILDRQIKAKGARTVLYLSPAGSAFYDVYINHPEIELYQNDGSHPVLAGSYLAALCHYATVYGKSPVGVSFVPNGISADVALILQTAAHRAVFGGSIIPESYRTSSTGVGN